MLLAFLGVVDSLNARFIGTYPFGTYTYKGALYANSNIALVPLGGGINVLSISNKFNPIKISEIHTRGVITSVKLYGNRVYISTGRYGFEVWDISDITNLQPIAVVSDYCGFSRDIGVKDGYVFLATTCGVKIYDSTFNLVHTIPSPALKVHIYGDTAIVVGDSVKFFDISNPSTPTIIRYIYLGMVVKTSLLHNNYLFISAYYGSTNKLKIYDITSTSENEILLPLFSHLDTYSNKMLGVVDNSDTIIYMDISNPLYPMIDSVKTFDTLAYSYIISAKIFGDTTVLYGYLDNTVKLKIFSGFILSEYTPNFLLSAFDINGNVIYASTFKGLCIIDFSTPSNPRMLRCFDTIHMFQDVLINGNLLLAIGDTNLYIYDISTPLNPTPISSIGGISGGGIAVKDTFFCGW